MSCLCMYYYHEYGMKFEVVNKSGFLRSDDCNESKNIKEYFLSVCCDYTIGESR
jgi:hypothetical protein